MVLLVSVCLACGLMIGAVGAAAAGNPSGTGQPNASCEDSTLEPNAFSSGGFANADLHYAGNGAPSLSANCGTGHGEGRGPYEQTGLQYRVLPSKLTRATQAIRRKRGPYATLL